MPADPSQTGAVLDPMAHELPDPVLAGNYKLLGSAFTDLATIPTAVKGQIPREESRDFRRLWAQPPPQP